MPLFQTTNIWHEPGTIISSPADTIIYKVLNIKSNPPGSRGNARWQMQLVRASDEESIVFRIMEG
jgi:diaminopimelate decarboxylase